MPESRLNLFSIYTTRMPFTSSPIAASESTAVAHSILHSLRIYSAIQNAYTESNNRLSNLLPKNLYGVRSMCCAPVFMFAFMCNRAKKKSYSDMVWAEKWPCTAIVKSMQHIFIDSSFIYLDLCSIIFFCDRVAPFGAKFIFFVYLFGAYIDTSIFVFDQSQKPETRSN